MTFTRLSIVLVAVVCLSNSVIGQDPGRVVDLKATDGTVIKATYFASAMPGPGVLLLHQCNRERKVWHLLPSRLAAAGINVLTIDYRGFGESGGERFDKLPPQEAGKMITEKWPGDIDLAFQYLQSQPGVNRNVIGVGGASCGVNNSVQTARRHSDVKSLVLLSGNTNLDGRNYLRSPVALPAFFALADDDEFKPSITSIKWLYSLTGNPGKELVQYSNGGHGADIFPVHPELMSLIVDWYVQTLIKTPGKATPPANAPVISADILILNEIDKPGGAKAVSKKLVDAQRANPDVHLFDEAIVNLIGYEHLQAGDVTTAIEILKLNAEAYPNSPNVYDSLGDVYMAAGERDLARENSKKALAMLATDTKDPEDVRKGIHDNAEQKLKQLGAEP